MQKQVTRFHVIKINTANFEDDVQSNAELATLHAEGWTVIDVQPVEERGKMYWMAIMAPPRFERVPAVDTSELLVAAPFIAIVGGLISGLVMLIGGGA